MKVTDKYVLFWSGIFSNFANVKYVSHDGIFFCCSEQEFMYRKAVLFNDMHTAEKILKATNPKNIKSLGREVRNFSESRWNEACEEFMYQACLSKFTQDPKARKAILQYPGLSFVEASPYDRKWGIGLRETDLRALDSATWRGQNLLGRTLDRVRETILADS